MKFKMISEADVKVLREARKVLKRLKKRENKLEVRTRKPSDYPYYDKWVSATRKYRCMLDELRALYIDVYEDELSLTSV